MSYVLTIEQSLEALLQHKKLVIRRFYERFLEEVPEARSFFIQVDLDRQATMLTMALMVVEAHSRGEFPAVAHYLRVLGDRHHDLGVPSRMYRQFLNSLVDSIREFHAEQWHPALELQWRAALEKAIRTMLEGYKEPVVF